MPGAHYYMKPKKAKAPAAPAPASLVRNIQKRRKAGTSRSKKNSTVSPKAYAAMKKGWPKKGKKKK